MNWKKLFEPRKILTDSDRAELEKIDEAAAPYQRLLDTLPAQMPGGIDREGRLFALAGRLAEDPTNRELADQYKWTAAMPAHPHFCQRHLEILQTTIGEKIQRLFEPQGAICRRILQRALEQAEAELKKSDAQERKAAEADGFPFSPSGKVLALQQRVLQLRNEVAAKIPGEPDYHSLPHWRQRLADFL